MLVHEGLCRRNRRPGRRFRVAGLRPDRNPGRRPRSRPNGQMGRRRVDSRRPSHYLDWLQQYRDSGEPRPCGRDCPAAFQRVRREFTAATAARPAASAETEMDDEAACFNSSPGFPGECSGRPSPGWAADRRGQSAPEHDHAKHGGGVLSEHEEPLHRPPAGPPPRQMPGRNESPSQPSTSSTSPAPPDAACGGES
jgi:hypothetical protein